MTWRESDAIQAGNLICLSSLASHYTKGKVYPLENIMGEYHVCSGLMNMHKVSLLQGGYNNHFAPHIVQLEND